MNASVAFWTGDYWTQALANGRDRRLRNAMAFYSAVHDRSVWIPGDFICDLTSVPRLFWSIFPPTGKYERAAVLHDWLYWAQIEGISRAMADAMFLEAMIVSRVGYFTRTTIYRAVRLGGGSAWKNNAKAKARGVNRIFDPTIHRPLAMLGDGSTSGMA